MSNRGLRSIVAFSVTMLMAVVAAAQLSSEYAGWADGPEGFLLTKKEKKAWQKIASDAEAEKFIELFWASRNPDPNAAFNTFRAEFEAKVRYADEHFAYTGRRGSLSDRGRVLVLMGRPEGAQTRGPQQNLPPVGTTAGGTGAVEGSTQVWFYDPAKLPEGFKAKGAQLFFMFYEEQPGSNNYIIDRSNREAFKGLAALNDAPEVYLLHPDLKQVPKPVTIAGAEPAAEVHLGWIGDDAPFNETVRVIAELGVTDDVSRPLWIHLELPADAPALEVLAGRVLSAADEVLSTFELSPTAIAGQYGTAYHLSIPLDPGPYTVEIVGAAAGEPLVTERISAEVSRIPDEGTWMSPLELGVGAEPNQEARLGDPFSFGGWHLRPITGPDLGRDGEIVFFGFLVRPARDENGTIDLKARIQLSRDGKLLGRALTMPLETSQVIGDLHMYGNSISLSALPEAGAYEIEFEIMEGVSETSVERALPLDIID